MVQQGFLLGAANRRRGRHQRSAHGRRAELRVPLQGRRNRQSAPAARRPRAARAGSRLGLVAARLAAHLGPGDRAESRIE